MNGFDIFSWLERRLNARRLETIRQTVLHNTQADPTLLCTLNTEVFNHGARNNIVLGAHIILDGTLECFEQGKMEIGPHTFVGRSRLFCAERLLVGEGVMISDNVIIMDSDLHPISGYIRYQDMKNWAQGRFPDVYSGIKSAPVSIGHMAWIGANSVILKDVHIGEGAIIGAGAIVTKDVPSWTVVAGNPARVIRELTPHER